MVQRPDDAVVVGAGLVGSLLATLLAERGLSVTVYEKRTDPRNREAESGRSINLVLTRRGVRARKVTLSATATLALANAFALVNAFAA